MGHGLPEAARYPDLDSLALFLDACEAGSISAAGRLRGITQPAATGRIRQLERRLGVTLLHRSTTGCSPTDAGRTVAAWAQELLGSADRLVAGTEAFRTATARVALRVTASYTTAEYLLPQALIELRGISPTITVSLSVANSAEVIDDVRSERSQLGFIEGTSIPRGLRHRSVATDRLVVIAAAASTRTALGALDAGALAAHTLVLREPGSGTREVFLRALTDAGAHAPSSVIEMGSTAAIMQAVAAGDALGVVSDLALREHEHTGRLRTVPIPQLQLQRTLRAIWQAQHSGAVSDVVDAAIRAGQRLDAA